MADLIAYQDGNFTGATTFRAVVGGTGSAQTSISGGFTNTTTSYVSSSAFTVTNTHVIEGVLMYCNRNNTTGTVDVALSDDNGTTQTRTVSVNASDLPAFPSWVFFKFGTTLTGDGGADYRVQVRGSSAGNAVFYRDATANNWTRLLRRNTSATIATTDVVYISGERTGAGSVTPITVTMDSTATTSYGAMNIGDAGTVTFGTSASTNYYLRLAGNLNIYANGTLNIGTSTTRIPSTSTATLEFNVASHGQFGLNAFAGSTVNVYGAERQNTKVLLTATAASGQAVITVQDTTGWVANDELGIAPTGTSATQNEKRSITTVDSGTQATLNSNLSFEHLGTSPFQAEVINLTRNVKIRGTSASLNSYLNVQSTAVVVFNHAEFFQFGPTAATGITVNVSGTGSALFEKCSFHEFALGRFAISGSSSTTFQDCVMYNIPEGINVNNGAVVIDGCWVIRGNTLLALRPINRFDNNRFSGAATRLTFDGNAQPTSFANNVFHSCGNGFTSANQTETVIFTATNCHFWRLGTAFSAGGLNRYRIIFEDCTFRNNTTQFAPVGSIHYFKNCIFDNLGVNTTTNQISGFGIMTFENCDFGQTNTATNFYNATSGTHSVKFIGCDIAETLTPVSQTNLLPYPDGTPSIIGFDKLNSTSGNHRAYKRFGYAGSDQSVYRTASPSEVLVPNSASGKLPSGSKKFGVASGNSATVSVWVRKSATYNGAEPRLILKRNIVGGVSSDQVLDTASGANETWLELTASTPTVTDDCVLEVYVDCDGTAGTVNVDDYSIS